MATRLGFDEALTGNVALVVTEAGTNIVKHGGGGELLVREFRQENAPVIEILALDRGPGMVNPDQCLRDGFSTSASPGTGLGAIKRLSSHFEFQTAAKTGTALLARVNSSAGADPMIGSINLSKPGEPVCGDAWAVEHRGERMSLLVADGLGHGQAAAEAAREAVRVFRDTFEKETPEVMQRIHSALRGTRGAAVAVADIDFRQRTLRYVGVGNISAVVVSRHETRNAVSHNGTVGHEARKISEFSYPFPPGALFIMHSDGVATSWKFDAYPGLASRDPSLIAGVLYRDFRRQRDDATIVAMREATAEPA
jgi:anti-sigma regulatory factor (Ser/Thr protein kinase)